MSIDSMRTAKREKNDEYFTRYSDAEAEISLYKKSLCGKRIHCNCDDPESSNIYLYLKDNFTEFGLESLTATKYVKDGIGVIGKVLMIAGKLTESIGRMSDNGSFDGQQSLDILRSSDIVITNPPFSVFRFYIQLMLDNCPDVLILGHQNSITCRDVFLKYLSGELHQGNRIGAVTFDTPDGPVPVNVVWHTTLDLDFVRPFIPLTANYTPSLYPKYDNYDIINVNKIKDIPCDYFGIMGVPITLLGKHNKNQFTVLGMSQGQCHDLVPDSRKYNDYKGFTQSGTKVGGSGQDINGNPVMLGDDGSKNRYINFDGRVVQSLYHRIFIRRNLPVGLCESFTEMMAKVIQLIGVK